MEVIPGITVRYIYSACVVTQTPDVRVLHDPWFSEGIYDGSWFHFPKIDDPVGVIGDVDFIYISHIHPDHYDAGFLKKYFSVYGKKPLIIADHNPNHLLGKMRADGLEPQVLKKPLQLGNTQLTIIPHLTGSMSDIDSAIIIRFFEEKKTHVVANANDIIFDQRMIEQLKEVAQNCDILLCGYTGAGPYPQTYFHLDDPQLLVEAEKKKHDFFARYDRLVAAIQPKLTIPFAGKYVLGGKLVALNSFRGVADSVEILDRDPRAVVLRDAGGWVSSSDLKPHGIRAEKYEPLLYQQRIQEISDALMDYEKTFNFNGLLEDGKLPLKRLLAIASSRAHKSSECAEDYYFQIPVNESEYALINANKNSSKIISFHHKSDAEQLPTPRSEIIIDPRYLFGLLTHVYHWNNAEVGSQFFTRRYPNTFNRKAQSFLNYLGV